jgi:hypothetical protein
LSLAEQAGLRKVTVERHFPFRLVLSSSVDSQSSPVHVYPSSFDRAA